MNEMISRLVRVRGFIMFLGFEREGVGDRR
jgi:hypothetical protein